MASWFDRNRPADTARPQTPSAAPRGFMDVAQDPQMDRFLAAPGSPAAQMVTAARMSAPVVNNLGSLGGYATANTAPSASLRPRPDMTQPMAQPQGAQDYSGLARTPEEAAYIQRIVDAQMQGYGQVRPGQVEQYLAYLREHQAGNDQIPWLNANPGKTAEDYFVERAMGMGAGGSDTATQGRYAGQNFGSLEYQQAGGAPFSGSGLGSFGTSTSGPASTAGLPWFTPPTGTDDPGFAFAMAEGQKALERSASAKGTLLTGGALKDLASYSTGMALQGYGDAWNRFDRTRNFHAGLLQNLSGMGLNAASNFGNNASDLVTGTGNANAAATAQRGANTANTIANLGNLGAEAILYRNRHSQPNIPQGRVGLTDPATLR